MFWQENHSSKKKKHQLPQQLVCKLQYKNQNKYRNDTAEWTSALKQSHTAIPVGGGAGSPAAVIPH